MHLGDEIKAFKYAVLVPFCVFIIYLVFIADLGEGPYARKHREAMDKNITEHAQNAEHGAPAHE